MGGILIGILLKGLGFGKMLLGWIWDIIKGICKFAVEKPMQFMVILLSLGLIVVGWWGLTTRQALIETQIVVEKKTEFIKQQDKIVKEYVHTIEIQKQTLIKTVKSHNQEVQNIKKAADTALAKAKAAGLKAEKKAQEYKDIADKYRVVGTNTGTPEERISREQDLTDEFIQDWRKAK